MTDTNFRAAGLAAHDAAATLGPKGRQNDALTDAELEVVVAAGAGAGVNPSRAERGVAGRFA